MISRKEHERLGIILPETWREKVESLLYNTYQEHCDADKKEFQVHAITWPDELLFTVSYLAPEKTEIIPVTYVMSLDLKEGENPEKHLDTLVDSIGIFFDSYFATADWSDYLANWDEAEYKKLKFFYRVSRENVALTIKAEQLLNQ